MSVLGRLRSRLAVVTVAACVALLAGTVGVAQAQFSWSSPISIDKSTGVSLSTLACPSATQCTTLDHYGRVLTFNPASPRAPLPLTIASMRTVASVACASASQCVIVGGGRESTFDPNSPGSPAAFVIDPGTPSAPAGLGDLVCESGTECTAIDGTDSVVTFNPVTHGSPSKLAIDTGAQIGLTALACPSTTQCTAIDGGGKEITFDPTSAGAPTSAAFSPANVPIAISCPSATQCTAVDQSGREATFNPQLPGAITPVGVDSEFLNGLLGLACRSVLSCTAVTQGGREVTFNPRSPGPPAPVLIDAAAGGDSIGQNTGLSDVKCPSGNCTAVDGNGQEVTFNPDSPNTRSIARIDSGSLQVGLACALETQCSSIDENQQVTFDPAHPGLPKPFKIYTGSAIGLSALACSAPTRCTATRASDELTFNPRVRRVPKARTIDPVSDEGISDIVCPSAGRCTIVDANSQEVFFDPRSGKRIKTKSYVSGGSFVAVSCPTTSQCTSVDNDGGMFTFVPATGKLIATSTIDTKVGLDAPSGDSNDELDGISCPTTGSCTAVDTLGNEVTFNPRSKHESSLKAIDAGNSLTAVACPSSKECVAVDSAGQAFLGEPPSGSWSPQRVMGATPFVDVQCQSTAECVAIDSTGDAFLGTGNSPAEIKGWLSQLLAPGEGALGVAAPKLAAVLRAGGVKVTFAALYAGSLRLRWYQVPRGAHIARSLASRRPVLVAAGSVSFGHARDATLKLKLTGPGRKLLQASRRVTLTVTGTLAAAGHTATGKRQLSLSR